MGGGFMTAAENVEMNCNQEAYTRACTHADMYTQVENVKVVDHFFFLQTPEENFIVFILL